jgi:hypothetical protein
MYLSQTNDPAIYATAQEAAVRLGLDFAHLPTGYGEMAEATVGFLDIHGISR